MKAHCVILHHHCTYTVATHYLTDRMTDRTASILTMWQSSLFELGLQIEMFGLQLHSCCSQLSNNAKLLLRWCSRNGSVICVV